MIDPAGYRQLVAACPPKDHHDIIALLAHATLVFAGLESLLDKTEFAEALRTWTTEPLTLRYRRTGNVYIMNVLKIGEDSLIATLGYEGQDGFPSMELQVGDIVHGDCKLDEPDKFFTLGAFAASRKIAALLDGLPASAPTHPSQPGASAASRAPPPSSTVRGDATGDSWLRIPPMQAPGAGGFGAEPPRNPLAYGHDDLVPGGLGGFGGGGMLLGPSDPLFAGMMGRGGMRPPGFGGGPMGPGSSGPGGMMPGMPANPLRDVPPGARFDPIGPIGARPGGRGRDRFGAFGTGDPDPDHLPPPGYGDMFM